jgi:hypothetical protein
MRIRLVFAVALVGIAIDRGELPGLDTPVLSFFADRDFANLDADKRP